MMLPFCHKMYFKFQSSKKSLKTDTMYIAYCLRIRCCAALVCLHSYLVGFSVYLYPLA